MRHLTVGLYIMFCISLVKTGKHIQKLTQKHKLKNQIVNFTMLEIGDYDVDYYLQHKFCKIYFNLGLIDGKLLLTPQRRLWNDV